MIRNIKVLGLALVAVFAMTAVAASAASAQQGYFTADGSATGDGVDIAGKNQLTAFGNTVECPESTYDVESTSGGLVASGSTTFTVTPAYNNSKCNSGGLKATVNMNGCDFVFHIGETTGGGETYGVTADLKCPAGKTVDIEAFLSASNENIKACTITFGETGNQGLSGPHLTNKTGGKVELSGTATGVHATESGLCGNKTTETGEYDTGVTISGTDSKGAATEISISD
jgi:uncharacterized membrane protein